MTDPQQSNPIDQLFRKTFEDLPSTPAESGWDTPSERVWEKVQHRMPRKSPLPNAQSLALVVVMSVGALVAFYLYLTQPTPPSAPPAAPASEVAVQPAARPAEESQTIDNQSVTTPAAAPKRSVRAAQPVAESAQSAERVRREAPRSSGALPLPGTSDVAKPNTTEERKAERARQLERLWKTPLDPLPLARQKRAPH
jgi:type IV secretory pathway VirB10-like protein